MNNQITLSNNDFHELVEHLSRSEELLACLVKTQEENTIHAAGKELVAFLDEVHKQLPDVPVEETEHDILQAVQAVRRGE